MAKVDGTHAGSATKTSASRTGKPHVSSKPKLKVSTGHIQAEGNEDQKASARKGALFLAGVVALYSVYLVFSGQMVQFLDALSTVDTHWVWLACLCYGFYFAFGVLAYVIAVFIDHDSPVGIRDLMSVEASGVFFGNLTPMMAGSVPSQIVRLTKTGLDPGEASATQFTRFIMFQFGVVLFAAIMLAAKLEFFFETYGDIVILNLIVFGVHMLELIALFVICLCPRFVMRAGMAAIRFCKRVGILKKQEDVDSCATDKKRIHAVALRRCEYRLVVGDRIGKALCLLRIGLEIGSEELPDEACRQDTDDDAQKAAAAATCPHRALPCQPAASRFFHHASSCALSASSSPSFLKTVSAFFSR